MSKREQNCDVFNEVTNSIIELIESGVKPFQKPWNDQAYNGLPMRHNGEYYKGVNPFILSLTSFVKGYRSGYWMTFKQAKEFKAQVRKGEKGTKIFKSGKTSKMVEMEELETGETKEVKQTFKYLKAYTVFNADQIEGLPEKFYFKLKDGVKPNPDVARPDLDTFFNAQGIEIKHGGNKAYYSITYDYIQMPEFKAFKQACGYYSTLAHEFVHSTGASKRLERPMVGDMSSEVYAREELIAELGASYLCAFFNLENYHIDDHATYLSSWLRLLKNNKREIFTAASKAQAAVDYLLEKGNFTQAQAA